MSVRSLILSVTILAGCAQNETETRITFWAMGNEGEHVQKLIPQFEKEHPGIKVKVQQIPWTAAHEKLLTAYAGNSLPDVCQLGNTWVPEFSMLNALENLDPWVAQSQIVQAEEYFTGIWETNIIDTTVFGIPWYVDTRLLFYRKDILAQAGYSRPPRTWDEWRDVSVKIIRQSPDKQRYAIFLPTNEWVPFIVGGLQHGSALLKDENRYGDFSGDEFVRSFQFLMSFYRDRLTPTAVTEITNVYHSMAEGYIAMYITGPWNIGEFSRRFPPELQDAWMTAPIPGPDTTYPGVSLAGGSSLVLFKSSAKKDAAWKFIEYLSEPRQQGIFYSVTGNLPAVRRVWEDSVLATNQYVQAFRAQLERVMPTPKIPEWEQIAMKVQQYAEQAATKAMTVQEALAALDRDVNAILEKRRWMLERGSDD
ncbi:MAG: sugar ABC transporter substrate-binding protein [Ignavibacteriae bacterium]|nr:sugar ABC transporter substrate-binding protein [Ignavibacteriota bacterium]